MKVIKIIGWGLDNVQKVDDAAVTTQPAQNVDLSVESHGIYFLIKWGEYSFDGNIGV